MTNKKPNYTISFDGEEYSKEEQEYLIFRFVQVLQRLDKEQKVKGGWKISLRLIKLTIELLKDLQILDYGKLVVFGVRFSDFARTLKILVFTQ